MLLLVRFLFPTRNYLLEIIVLANSQGFEVEFLLLQGSRNVTKVIEKGKGGVVGFSRGFKQGGF